MRYLNEQELSIATRFLFLSMAITVLDQDIQHVQKGAFKIKEPYQELLEKIAARARSERKDLRKTMYQYKIRVSALNRNESFSSYLFLAGKREEQRNYFNPAIRKHVEKIIREMMEDVLKPDLPHAAGSADAYPADNENVPSAALDS